jgi:hypothetical protein
MFRHQNTLSSLTCLFCQAAGVIADAVFVANLVEPKTASEANKYCRKENGSACLCIGYRFARAKEALRDTPDWAYIFAPAGRCLGGGKKLFKFFPIRVADCYPRFAIPLFHKIILRNFLDDIGTPTEQGRF